MDWNQRLSIGIASVDEEHRQLVRAFDELQGAMRRGKGSDAVVPTLRFLGDYAATHFASEEALMRRHAYPELAAHRREHEAFRSDFRRILHETERTEHRVAWTMDVSRRLLEWLLTHVDQADRRMAAHLAAQGLRER